MNIIIRNNKELYYICSWVDKNDNTRDSKGNKFPVPIIESEWLFQEKFAKKIKYLEKILFDSKKYLEFENKKKCKLCDQSYSNGTYKLERYIWEDNLTHYIEKHNIKPPEEFIDYIFFSKYKNIFKIEATIIKDDKIEYIKINKNQLLILDALLEHGGYNPKYSDLKNKNVYRYSEHSGLFDFTSNKLQKIVVLGNTNRVDKGDNEIYMPNNVQDMLNYEYIFHTHPPTPKPGGRVEFGIIYELPSIGDIFHFIDHFNDGKISGSVIITSEGLYNIRHKDLINEKLSLDEDKLYLQFNNISKKIQELAIKKYGYSFTNEIFYSKIAQEIDIINKLNNVLNNFKLHIDYIPRIKNEKNQWIINTIYLPIYK